MGKTVLVTGSRDWDNDEMLVEILSKLPPDTHIVHGACRGADQQAGVTATSLGLSVTEYPADWKTHGKKAGAIRNREMFDASQPDLVIAFHDDLYSSKGTKDMVKYALEKNCGVVLVTYTYVSTEKSFIEQIINF